MTFPAAVLILKDMKVILAGYNVDSETISELRRHAPPRADVTPETLSASYARISRDPRPVDELRALARAEVERARRSNQNIIFKMGHHSVAEHAVFNFDILAVSRLAIEEIEKFRLCSFTEKSQRYIKLGDDFVIPEEIGQNGGRELFLETIRAQNRLYHGLYDRLKPYFFEKYAEAARNPKNHAVLDGWAKEDARYAVSLATEGQLGLTINGRNLEHLIRRLASGNTAELRDLGARMCRLAQEVAPSIILFTGASDFDSLTYPRIEKSAKAALPSLFMSRHPASGRRAGRKPPRIRSVRLAAFTPDGDDRLLAALAHKVSSASFDQCLSRVRKLPPSRKRELALEAFRSMEFYDFPPREFEHVDVTFDLVVSASCFAQLKRHRMATLTCQQYDPALGVTVPPSVEAVGAHGEFVDIMERTNEAHAALRGAAGCAADYVLTNAHRRRVLLKLNIRELYHVSRLREDGTAQWDIRRTAGGMSRLAAKAMPLACLLLGGKDGYPEVYRAHFGSTPKASPPKVFQ